MGSLSGSARSSKAFWDDLFGLVRRLGKEKLSQLDPVSGPSRVTEQFELLVTAGLQASADVDDLSADGLHVRIPDHVASTVLIRGLIEANGDHLEHTGGYLDLMWRWLQARAIVLSFLYRETGATEPFEEPALGQHGDLEAEAILLARILGGVENPVPEEFGFPGIFVWLTEAHGAAASAVYASWK
jgi:hypothetical protein